MFSYNKQQETLETAIKAINAVETVDHLLKSDKPEAEKLALIKQAIDWVTAHKG